MMKYRLIALIFSALYLTSCAVAIKQNQLNEAFQTETLAWKALQESYISVCHGPINEKYSLTRNLEIANCNHDETYRLVGPLAVYKEIFDEMQVKRLFLIHDYKKRKIDTQELRLKSQELSLIYMKTIKARASVELEETQRRMDAAIDDIQRQEFQRQVLNSLNNHPTKAYCSKNSNVCQLH